MAKRIVGIVAAVLVVCLLYLGYQRYSASQQSDSGAIHSDDLFPSTDSSTTMKPRPAAPPVSVQPASPAIPASDSIAPNPPNGATFSGTGRYQVYRQGNLTWRLDTESGETCILFATMEEWRKPIVYQHACNRS